MKKSKIIIPALAMIAFSTAASIAGSVAWFTANRQATISAGTYTVVKTTANLETELKKGVGTTVSNNQTVSFGDNKLTDASLNHGDKKIVYPDSTGKAYGGSVEIGGPLATDEAIAALATSLERGESGSGKIYSCATFDISFTIAFGAIEKDVGLYLNTTKVENDQQQQVAQSRFETTGTAYTAKGFRMAFLPMGVSDQEQTNHSAQYAKIFAGLQKETETVQGQSVTNIKYVHTYNNDGMTGAAYDSTKKEVVDTDYHTALPTSSTSRSDAIDRADCLGFFKFQAGTRVTLNYRVVAWFEGTDPEIKNRETAAEYQSVASFLTFDAIDIAAATQQQNP